MDVLFIISLALGIIIYSILRAFGSVVGAGINPLQSISNKGTFREVISTSPQSQLARTIAGVLFGILLMCPLLYMHRINGEPFVNINHVLRNYIVGFFVTADLLAFLIIWNTDRKPQQKN